MPRCPAGSATRVRSAAIWLLMTRSRLRSPQHTDHWVARSVGDRDQRAVVSVASTRIKEVCRDVAGFSGRQGTESTAADVPLGHFADALAVLMPGADGIGARRTRTAPTRLGRGQAAASNRDVRGPDEGWVDAHPGGSPVGEEPATAEPAGWWGATAQPVLRNRAPSLAAFRPNATTHSAEPRSFGRLFVSRATRRRRWRAACPRRVTRSSFARNGNRVRLGARIRSHDNRWPAGRG